MSPRPVIVLLCSLVVPAGAAAEQARPGEVRRVTWTYDGTDQRLLVRARDEGELELVEQPGRFLRSAVGPMVASLQRRHWLADDGGWVTLAIETTTLGSFRFDLIAWLDASRQSGAAMQQLLRGDRCGLDSDCHAAPAWPKAARCPTATAVAAWDGAFADLATMLSASGCFDAAALMLDADAFWIDDVHGDRVRLAVQREACESARSTCIGDLVYLDIVPPESWRPWLADAAAGRGRLARTRPADAADAPGQGATPLAAAG